MTQLPVPAPERGPALVMPRPHGSAPVDQMFATNMTNMAAGQRPGNEQAPAWRRGRLRGYATVSGRRGDDGSTVARVSR